MQFLCPQSKGRKKMPNVKKAAAKQFDLCYISSKITQIIERNSYLYLKGNPIQHANMTEYFK